jgi:hypothetical protein
MSRTERSRRHRQHQAERVARMEAALSAILAAAEGGTIGPKWAAEKAREGLAAEK